MPGHIQLQEAHCVICLCSMVVGERGVAVLGDLSKGQQRASTRPFDFPAHGHKFQKTTVHINKREETWRLCRYPPCSVCSKSPKAFICHVDCCKIAKARLSKLPIPSIWLLRHLSSPPSAGLCGDFAHLAIHTDPEDPADSLPGIIKGLKMLPKELWEMIAGECPESPLWRYSVVNAFTNDYMYTSQALIKVLPRVEFITPESSKTSFFLLSRSNILQRETQRSFEELASGQVEGQLA